MLQARETFTAISSVQSEQYEESVGWFGGKKKMVQFGQQSFIWGKYLCSIFWTGACQSWEI